MGAPPGENEESLRVATHGGKLPRFLGAPEPTAEIPYPPRRTPGYRLDRSDPEVLVLRSPSGEAVARFSASGYSPESVEREAWEDHGRRNGGKPPSGPLS